MAVIVRWTVGANRDGVSLISFSSKEQNQARHDKGFHGYRFHSVAEPSDSWSDRNDPRMFGSHNGRNRVGDYTLCCDSSLHSDPKKHSPENLEQCTTKLGSQSLMQG
jgi:hypothetical protein